MSFGSFSTLGLFIAFIGIAIVLYWPSKNKPYKDAEKIALKEETDEPVNPRQNIHHD